MRCSGQRKSHLLIACRHLRALGLLALAGISTACEAKPDRDAYPEESVSAAPSPSFDCDSAERSIQELICEDASLARLDLRLDSVFLRVVTLIQSYPDTMDLGGLRAYQRGWISGRDDCWKDADPRSCVESAYRDRTAELEAHYMLASAGRTVRWACDGNPANEFVTTHFETDPPTIRVERGDQVAVAWHRPAASGTRYQGPFGSEFWMQGDEAQVEWPEGTSMTCTARQD